MYAVQKNAPGHGGDDIVVTLGKTETVEQAFEVIRAHFLEVNQSIVAIEYAPPFIRQYAQRNIDRNSSIQFELREGGMVYVDGEAPEMDYYTITEA